MTEHEVTSIKWWLDVRKSTPTEPVDEAYILANKKRLGWMLKLDIGRYKEYVTANPTNDKAYKYLGFLQTTYEWLQNA
jgi:hypothetical protein